MRERLKPKTARRWRVDRYTARHALKCRPRAQGRICTFAFHVGRGRPSDWPTCALFEYSPSAGAANYPEMSRRYTDSPGRTGSVASQGDCMQEFVVTELESLPDSRASEWSWLRLALAFVEPVYSFLPVEVLRRRFPTQSSARLNKFLVARGDQRLLGAATLTSKHQSSLGRAAISVAPAWRRRGIGTRLMQAIMAEATGWGVRTLSFYTGLGEIERFGERIGAIPTGPVKVLRASFERGIPTHREQRKWVALPTSVSRGLYSEDMVQFALEARSIMGGRTLSDRTKESFQPTNAFVIKDALLRHERGEDALFVVLKEASGRLLSFVEMRLPDRTSAHWVVDQVGVIPEMRGRGLGRHTLGLGLRAALDVTPAPVALAVVDDANRSSLAIHMALGFSVDREYMRWEVRT